MTLEPNPIDAKAARISRQALGTPYVWGGTNLRLGVDCSGLCYRSYQLAGYILPGRNTYTIWDQLNERVTTKDIVAGDLLFLEPSPAGPQHMVMALDNATAIAAQHRGTVVRTYPITYFTQDHSYMGARRPKPASGKGTGKGSFGSGGATPAGGGSSGVSGVFGDITSGVGSVASGVKTIIDPHTWLRVGQVILGLVLLVGGFLLFAHKEASFAAGLVPAGRAIKVAKAAV